MDDYNSDDEYNKLNSKFKAEISDESESYSDNDFDDYDYDDYDYDNDNENNEIVENNKLTNDLVFIVATSRAITDSYINLNLIARKLELTENIVGKKMLNVISEGEIKSNIPSKKHKNNQFKFAKKKNKKRADFSNQLTLIINLYDNYTQLTDNKFYNSLLINAIEKRNKEKCIIENNCVKSNVQLNLKIFGNGKIMITGGLTLDECKKAVMIFQKASVSLEDYLFIDYSLTLNDIFEDVGQYSKYIKKYYLHLLKLFSILSIDLDIKIDLILNKKALEQYKIDGNLINLNNYSMNQSMNILITGTPENIVKYEKLIQAFNIIHLYYPDRFLLNKLKENDSDIVSYITRLYNGEHILFPSTFTKKIFIKEPQMSIQNYNTMFGIKFNIDRDQLTNIINTKYINNDMSPAHFDPSSYQGIKAKYICRLNCPNSEKCISSGSKKSLCCCKELTFLIFQNKVIVTGGRIWDQIINGYNYIKNIIESEYENICIINNNVEVDKTNQPLEIEYNNNKYINKHTIVYGNPRNYYILKKYNLLHLYN